MDRDQRIEKAFEAMFDTVTRPYRNALQEVANIISPWATHCDYRAEEDIQKALALIHQTLNRR